MRHFTHHMSVSAGRDHNSYHSRYSSTHPAPASVEAQTVAAKEGEQPSCKHAPATGCASSSLWGTIKSPRHSSSTTMPPLLNPLDAPTQVQRPENPLSEYGRTSTHYGSLSSRFRDLWCLFSPGLQFQHSLMSAISTQSNTETWISTTVITISSGELRLQQQHPWCRLVTLAPFQK